MKLLSALFAAALFATVAPATVAASHHNDASSLATSEQRLDNLLERLTQLETRLEDRESAPEFEEADAASAEEEDFGAEESEEAEGEEESEENENAEEEETADSDEAEVADPVLSTFSKFTHTWGGPGAVANQNAWFNRPHLSPAALGAGWAADAAKPCASGTAKGLRYRPVASDSNSNAMWLLYGANGELAGVQSVVSINPGPKAIAPYGPYVQEKGVDGSTVWTITAYFRNPKDDSICAATTPKTGRSANGLWLPYTGDAATAEAVPLSVQPKQTEFPVALAGQRPFTQGKCMSTMGVHWWRARWNDKCDGSALDPYFLLYHPKTHQLLGFGLLELSGVATEYQAGNFWEHVPIIAAPIFQTVSQLSLDLLKGAVDGRKFKLQSQHFYFIDDPKTQIQCIPFFPAPIPPASAQAALAESEAYAAKQTAGARTLPKASGPGAKHRTTRSRLATRVQHH